MNAFLVRSACPHCGQRNVVWVRHHFAVTGPAVVAGVNAKLAAVRYIEYKCTACGESGKAESKHSAAEDADATRLQVEVIGALKAGLEPAIVAAQYPGLPLDQVIALAAGPPKDWADG